MSAEPGILPGFLLLVRSQDAEASALGMQFAEVRWRWREG